MSILRAATARIGEMTVKLDALPDTADFRDRIFVTTLVEVPVRMPLEDYLTVGVPVRNQGSDGSCTGFALSTVAHYLLRTRKLDPDHTLVSARMFYEMAKRYDEWAGEAYEGSSARGAIKGWHKHGVCADALWSYADDADDRSLTRERSTDALKRPLGAYYRVNPRDLAAMHSALAEVGVLFATAVIHAGWRQPNESGAIPLLDNPFGGHAFAIVGFDERGFWLQNSWGDDWGVQGCALLTYDDWLCNAMDVWVARLGVPVQVSSPAALARSFYAGRNQPGSLTLDTIRSHIVRLDSEGGLSRQGTYANFEADVARIFAQEMPAQMEKWPVKRLLLYANGGLHSEQEAVRRMLTAGASLLSAEVYPVAFIWNTDLLGNMSSIVRSALGQMSPDTNNVAGEFTYSCAQTAQGLSCEWLPHRFDRSKVDNALEPLVRTLAGKFLWDHIKQFGWRAASNTQGAIRIVLKHLARFLEKNPSAEVHILGYSAGSIFLAPLVQLLTAPTAKIERGPLRGKRGYGIRVKTCALWAPAITVESFRTTYLPAIDSGAIEALTLYTLTDQAEQRDCCIDVYSKSLLYLISNALEARTHIPFIRNDGEPLLGMEKFIRADPALVALFKQPARDWILTPNDDWPGTTTASRAQSHLQFDEEVTLRSTILRVIGEA